MTDRLWCEVDKRRCPQDEFDQRDDRYWHTPPGSDAGHWADGLSGDPWSGAADAAYDESDDDWQVPSQPAEHGDS
jgi:hypothetical protein